MLATDASVYLFILEVCLCPFGRPVKFETKRGKSLLFEACWTACETSHSIGHLHRLHSANTHTHTHGTNTHRHSHPSPSFIYLFISASPALPLLSFSLRVVLEYLRCVIRHWFPSEPKGKKKYLTERYIKRGHSEFLTFFAQLLQNE